jgi:hypothetical protein
MIMVGKESRYTSDQLRALVYRDRPYIFNGIRSTLSELLSIARTYAPLQKYEVTLTALTAIVKLLAGYLRVRDGDLMMPSSIQAMMGPTEFEFDTVLTEAMEGISALHKAAIRGGDVQLSQQIIDALEYLALQSVGMKSLFGRPDENPTTAFIRAYMFGPIQDGAIRGLDDVAMAGAKAQSNIGKALLKKHQYLTARTTIDDIEKLAHLGIIRRKAHVTGTPVRGIAEILQLALTEPVAQRNTIHAALDALQRICIAELQFKSSPLDQSLRFAIGAVLDVTQPTALSNLEAQAIQGLSTAMEEGNVAKADEYREAIRGLNEGLWERLVAIGTAAAKTGSFALFDVNSNIAGIAKYCFWLLGFLSRTKPEAVDQTSAHNAWLHEKFAAEIEEELKWIVGATYWRIFDALTPPINRNAIWQFFPTLSHIGIQALDAGVTSVAESAITELKSMALTAIETPVGTLSTAARIAVFIAKIGIVAQKVGEQTILGVSVTALKEFQARYFAKQREIQPESETYDATLLNELQDLREELRGQHWLIDEEEAAFSSRVTEGDIDDFIALIEQSS